MIGAEGEPEIRPLSSSQVVSRPVAQEQSARLISGRPRSVTARDDHPSLFELRMADHPSPAGYGLAGQFPRVAEAD